MDDILISQQNKYQILFFGFQMMLFSSYDYHISNTKRKESFETCEIALYDHQRILGH